MVIPVTLDTTSDLSFSFLWLQYILSFAIFGVISYYGILMCYQANSKGDGKYFFMRFSALGLPIMIRVSLFALVAVIPFTLLMIFASNLVGNLDATLFPYYNFLPN